VNFFYNHADALKAFLAFLLGVFLTATGASVYINNMDIEPVFVTLEEYHQDLLAQQPVERTLTPTLNLNAPHVREMHLFGDFMQDLGQSFLGLRFLSTDEFGPYTVISIYGTAETELVRMGFFEINSEGNLILHFRFIETPEGDLVLDPITQEWNVSINYPFIELSRNDVTLLTTFYFDEDDDRTFVFDYDDYEE